MKAFSDIPWSPIAKNLLLVLYYVWTFLVPILFFLTLWYLLSLRKANKKLALFWVFFNTVITVSSIITVVMLLLFGLLTFDDADGALGRLGLSVPMLAIYAATLILLMAFSLRKTEMEEYLQSVRVSLIMILCFLFLWVHSWWARYKSKEPLKAPASPINVLNNTSGIPLWRANPR
jgi:hypothetical protein